MQILLALMLLLLDLIAAAVSENSAWNLTGCTKITIMFCSVVVCELIIIRPRLLLLLLRN